MRYFWISLLLGLFSYQLQPVFADAISPPLLSYQVQAGEQFEFDLVFYSETGGDYDVLIRSLVFTPEGGQKYTDVDDGVLTLEGGLLHFEEREERYVPVRVNVPADVNNTDLQYVIGLRKRTQTFDSFELSSVVLLAVGETVKAEGKIVSSTVQYSESDASIVQAVDYRFENTTPRLFTASPQLKLVDDQGDVYYHLMGPTRVFFPDYLDDASFVLKPKKEIFIPEDVRTAVFQLVSGDIVLDEVFLEAPAGKKILAAEKASSPLSRSYRERRRFDFLYNPIFTRFAILIGLTLVGVSFLMKEKK